MAAEEAAAAQAEAKKAKKQRQKAKKQQPPFFYTPEEPHQSEQTQTPSTQGESAQTGAEMGPSVEAQHAQGAAEAQHVLGPAGAQQLSHGMQDNQAEASLTEFVSVREQLHVQPVHHELPEVQAETSVSAMDVLDEMLQSAAAQATASGSCEEHSPALPSSSERNLRPLFCCPIRKVWYALCDLCCLLLHPKWLSYLSKKRSVLLSLLMCRALWPGMHLIE